MEILSALTHEIRELDVGSFVPTIEGPGDPLVFLRDYVNANKPVVIKGCVSDGEVLRQWTPDYLREQHGATEVTVDVTPHGYGDAVVNIVDPEDPEDTQGQCFATPEKCRMSLSDFLDYLHRSRYMNPPEVPYLQHQNNNLREELPGLVGDLGSSMKWAEEVFSGQPEAVNLWIGDERSVTSFHKDHYENLYLVVSGKKSFTLLPPSDVYRMHLNKYPKAVFTRMPRTRKDSVEDGPSSPRSRPDHVLRAKVTEPLEEILWSPIHAAAPGDMQDLFFDEASFPLYYDPSLPPPLHVELGPGDVLYLPSLWWHHVRQEPDPQHKWVVAVNFWYNMKFDVKYAYYKMVENLASSVGLLPSMLQEQGEEEVEEEEAK